MYYPFNNVLFQQGLSNRISADYLNVLDEMTLFCSKYLQASPLALQQLVGGLVDTILADDSFTGVFDVGQKQISKNGLDGITSFALQPFLISIWSNILLNHPNSAEGKETYMKWTRAIGYNSAREIITDVGAERAKKITVSTANSRMIAENTVTNESKSSATSTIVEPVEIVPKQEEKGEQTLIRHNGRIYNQHADKIVNIEKVENLFI